MTTQEITKATETYLNNKTLNNDDFKAMFEEIIDENLNASLYNSISVVDDVIEAIEESGFEDDEYGDFPKLKVDDLYDIFTQTI